MEARGGVTVRSRVRIRRALAAWGATFGILAPALLGCPAPARFPAPDLKVGDDPALVARGDYLANHVAVCVECHSTRDWNHYGGPAVPGTEGGGGDSFVEIYKLPPEVSMPAPNISPAGLGDWTDGEIFRAITGGLDNEGEAIFVSMPFNQYRHMGRGDLLSLVAYLRAMKPVSRALPARDLKYRMVEDIANMFPADPVVSNRTPQPGDRDYGAYLVNIASCRWCHTPSDAGGWPLLGRDFSGGTAFAVPPPGDGTVYATNITPDIQTGIGAWTKDVFVARFKGTTPEAVRERRVEQGFNSLMAWSAYSGMTEEDLGAIYDHLMSRPPIRNAVPRWTPDTEASP